MKIRGNGGRGKESERKYFGIKPWDVEFAKNLDELPLKAKEVFLRGVEDCVLSDKNTNTYVGNILSEYGVCQCKSPIEKILYVAMETIRYCADLYCEITPQYEIECGKKRYFADFNLMFLEPSIERECTYNLIVECDGHENHSSKAQIAHDNEREMDIRMAGYDVVRFSGTQIYSDPFGCAKDVMWLGVTRLDKGAKNGDL